MRRFVSIQTSRCQESLFTSFPVAHELSFFRMRSLDMLLKVLCLKIRLVAALEGANVGPIIRMRSQMHRQSCWSIEDFRTAFVGALDGFQFGWKLLAPRREWSNRRIDIAIIVRELGISWLVVIRLVLRCLRWICCTIVRSRILIMIGRAHQTRRVAARLCVFWQTIQESP